MDCNLPEMLARDLEMSEAVFISKRMTAGAPPPELAVGRSCSLPADLGNNIAVRPAQYHRILTTIRSLGELEEWSCTKLDEAVEDNNESGADEGPSPDSTSESSVGIEPPCIRCREPSVTTAPTSVTSRRCSSPLQTPLLPDQSPSPMGKNPQDSWVDLGPDDDIGDRSRTSSEAPLMDEQSPSSSLAGRDDEVMETKTPQTDDTNKEGDFVPFHLPVSYSASERPRTSSGVSSQDKPGWVGTQPPIKLPKRRSSLRQQLPRTEPDVDQDTSSKSTSSITGPAACLPGEANGPGSPSSTAHATACDSSGTAIDASLPLDKPGSEDQAPKDIEVAKEDELSAEKLPKTSSGPRQVHDWLESSNGIELSPLFNKHLEHSAPGIPLPPEVVETLRISVVCFPETMLLSSSLTIETIRSYSKKFRHDDNQSSPDDQSILSFGTSAVDTPKRWKLSNLLAPRRVGPPKISWSKPTSVPSSPRHAILPGGIGMASSPNWSPLKNIFPTGSDYLCDALYAHIVAYNYITTICGPGHESKGAGQNAPFDATSTRGSAKADERNPSSPIPKKAASLLGLSGVVIGAARPKIPVSAGGMLGGNRKKFCTDNGGGGGATGPRSPASDPSMRELQAGLRKCTSRLVATLKLTGEPSDRDSPGMKAEAAVEVDGLLLRALCEVVRCSEEKR